MHHQAEELAEVEGSVTGEVKVVEEATAGLRSRSRTTQRMTWAAELMKSLTDLTAVAATTRALLKMTLVILVLD